MSILKQFFCRAPFLAVCIVLVGSYILYPLQLAQAQEPLPVESTYPLEMVVLPDRGILIRLTDDPAFSKQHSFLTAYVVYSSCLGDKTQSEIVTELVQGTLCSDSSMQISLTQPGGYDLSPPEDSMVVIGSCGESTNNCQEHPELFTVLQSNSVHWRTTDSVKHAEIISEQIVHGE